MNKITNEQQDPESNEALRELVNSHIARMSEHFDSVLVIATKKKSDTTMTVKCSGGNWYASYGAAKEWMVQHDENARINERGNYD